MNRLLPRRLNELTPIKSSDSEDDLDEYNCSINDNISTQRAKLQPKRLSELLDSFEDDDEDEIDLNNCIGSDQSSGFNESAIDTDSNGYAAGFITPFDRKNKENFCEQNSSPRKCSDKRRLADSISTRIMKPIEPVLSEIGVNQQLKESVEKVKYVKGDLKPLAFSEKITPLQPRSLSFSPPKNQIKNVSTPQSLNNVFATPSIKPPLTTGRVIFSTSQQKHKKPQKLNSDLQKTLFTTPQSLPHRPAVSNTSDYVTDSFNAIRKTPIVSSYLSPIEEDKITVDELNNFSNADNDNALMNKIIEINKRDFVLKKKIGSGGSSKVFLAQRKDLLKDCALKVVNLKAEANIAQSYLNETKLLQKLQGSDTVVKLFEYYHSPERNLLFMVMEMGETDLNKVLKSYKSDIPLNKIVSYWHQMLKAVQHIHYYGVIHSDLKPANFLLVNGRLKLIDFGIASNISADTTSVIKCTQTGTLNYISPEALIDTSTGNTPVKKVKFKISTKSDVWSLGCIFYLCVYGQTPFAPIKQFYAKFAAITNKETEINYPQIPIYYPPMLIEIIQKCLQFDPHERYSVAELLEYPFNLIDESIL